MDYLQIEKVIGREIIDSRGNPTVEAEVYLADGTIGSGAAPSGSRLWSFATVTSPDSAARAFPRLLPTLMRKSLPLWWASMLLISTQSTRL